MKECVGTGYDIDHCRVEKMGCSGCHYFRRKKRKNMKIKNVNLNWNVMYYDFNIKKLKSYNILGGTFVEELAKSIKKYKIENREQLKEYLKKDFMYHYWSKSEYEITIGGLHSKHPEEFEKIDVWYQIEMNFNHIVDYIIQEMQLFKKKEN